VSLRFDVKNPALRFMLCTFFFVFHQFFYWVMVRALLGQVPNIDGVDELVRAILNSAIALPLFLLLDKLREDES
jgi:rod shape-determining protein MreD